MNDVLLGLAIQKYGELQSVLNDFMRAYEMPPSQERKVLIESIKERTNHKGLHASSLELARIFMGRSPLDS